ncbi:MAG: pre-16S rRNA-processing nuclease YqgF [Fimbriimonadaceae bacterium]
MLGEKTILAIDPGRTKCGLALVHRDDHDQIHLQHRAIVPPEQIPTIVEELLTEHKFSLIVVGNGTRSRAIVESLREAMPSIGILVIDEHETTIQARERYWEHNPRRGIRKFIPATLQVPKDPIDDYAALVLAERVLKSE